MRVLDWLLDSDPALRWQVLHELADAPAEQVERARARVATEGLGARVLALQADDGTWAGAAWNREGNSTFHALTLLRLFGLDPTAAPARRAVDLIRANVTWAGCGPPECAHSGFFAGELEPCINGQVLASGASLGVDVGTLATRLVSEQLADGGWNCEVERGSTRSSFDTTICVLEGLLAWQRARGGTATLDAALRAGQEYLLERALLRRRSTGQRIERDRKGGADWTRFAFPTWWHYDVLRGLDFFRAVGGAPDARLAEAVELVRRKQTPEGWWLRETQHAGALPVALEEGPGHPSKWLTLVAMRVLRWFDGDQPR